MAELRNLPPFHFRAIMADPPWAFENWSEAGTEKNASQHYDCMTVDQIAALPVGHLADKDCALFLWATDPLLPQALQVMKAWGFSYRTVAFTWAKQTRTGRTWHMGPGYWTRSNPEMCLLGINGQPRRIGRGIRQLIVSPLREHSRKPDEVRSSIEKLVPGPYLELFARTEAPRWTAWGLETNKFKTEAA